MRPLQPAPRQPAAIQPSTNISPDWILPLAASVRSRRIPQGPTISASRSNQVPGSTLGALVTIRYTKSPYFGLEFNYTYARFTQKFRCNTGTPNFPCNPGDDIYFPGGVQNNASEYSFGYVIHPPREFFGTKPFVSLGLGATAFRPTSFGGQGLSSRARMTYFYAVGLEKELSPHFGLRGQLRQTFYKAPDFGQNLITLQQQTWTFEPGFGFVVHF